jgi:hypothetical protein
VRNLLVIAFAFCISTASGQLRSVTVYGSYVTALGKQAGFSTVRGLGVGVEGRVALADSFTLNLSFGYERYGTINQDSTLIKWNWKFWNERYAGNVRVDTLSDTLKAVLNPVQYMEVLPLLLTLSFEIQPFEGLSIRPTLGGGVLLYTRSLYMDEEWRKRFNSLNYTFEYDFRNFAPDKKGNPFAIVGGLEASYQIFSALSLTANSRFTSIIKTKGKFGYDEFPVKSAMSLSLGLSFLY